MSTATEQPHTPPARVWLAAARPRTLPAAVAPVLVGTAAASRFIAWRFVAALLVALAVQVAVNFANDYFDGVRGVDTAERVGPRRAVASGDVSPRAMKVAIAGALLVAGLAGLALAIAAGWELLVVGALSFVAALGYSGGPRPYASAGLGEVFVFVFFGLVATIGSAYVHDERVVVLSIVAAVPIGALASAILMVNNIRDIRTDRAAGKRTLAVRLGDQRSRAAYWVLIGAAFAGAAVVAAVAGSPWPLLAMASAVFLLPLRRQVRAGATAAELIGALGGTGRLELIFAVLLAAGLVLAR